MSIDEILLKMRESRNSEEKKCKFCSTVGVEGGEALRAEYYRRIIERYAKVVSFGEEKSIPELKRMVAPGECVEAKAAELGGEREALEFVKALPLLHAKLSVSFWLSPREALELGAGDVMDKAVLLCSLLLAQSANAFLRVIELDEGTKHPVVLVKGERGARVLDAVSGGSFNGSSADVALRQLSFEGKQYARSLYEFNNANYESFQ